MRKLTPQQQEVLDYMNDGWELGIDTGPGGSCRLQKGGIGEGGETITVLPSTLYKLDYLGYIERVSAKYPTHIYHLKTEKPVTDMKLVKADQFGSNYDHPSYGTMSFSRVQGHNGALFGSSVRHNHVVRLVISHAERHDSHGTEHAFSTRVIVEAYMSATQFAEAMSGVSGESPITLQFTEKDGIIESPALENKREQFEEEFKDRVKAITERINGTIKKGKDKNVPKWLIHDLEILKGWLDNNIPYLAEQFSEQMERSVTEAKGEIESFVANLIHQTGLEALADMVPQITSGQVEAKEIEEDQQ